jgi:hypothetical protein
MRTGALLALTLAVIGCSSSSDGGNNTGAGGTAIGAAGGTVTSSDGKVQLVIPAGAVSSALSFSITADTTARPANASALLSGSVYDFEPSGTVFATPATIRIPYQPSQLPVGTDQVFLSVYLRNGSQWDSIPSTIDTAAHVVTAHVSHFSDYGLCAGPCIIPGTGFVYIAFLPWGGTMQVGGGHVTLAGGVEWNNDEEQVQPKLGQLPPGISALVSMGSQSPGCPSICDAPVTLSLTASATAVPGTYSIPIDLVHSDGSVVTGRQIRIPLLITAIPGFALAVSPASLPLTGGSAVTTTATITRTNFTAAVTLSVTGLPSGVTASFAPATLTDTTLTSVVTFTATNAVPTGSSDVVIHGTGSGATDQSQTVTLVVAPFSIAAGPASAIITPGGSTTFGVKVIRSSGFAAPVSLAVTGLPAGVSAAFASTGVADSSTLTLTATSAAATGLYPLQVAGTAGAVTQQAPVTLQVAQSGGGYALDFSSCGFQPLWVAFQDSTGPWTAVNGSNDVYQLPTPTSQHVGFAFVAQFAGAYSTTVEYLSPIELSQIAALHTQCGAPAFPGFQTFNGVAAGTDSIGGAFGFISMAGGGTGVRSDGPFAMSVPVGTSPPYDVTGYLQRTESFLSDSDRVLINRNVSSPGTVNFAAGKTVAVDTATVQGGSPGDLYSVNMFYTTHSCVEAELYALAYSTPTFLLTGMSDSLQMAGDLHVLEINDQHGGDGQSLTTYFHTLPPRMTVALGTPLTPTIITLPAPYKRLSLALPSLPGDYTTVSLDGHQADGVDEYLVATRSYLGNGAVSLAMPDFSTVSGFSPTWEPGASSTLSTEVSAASSPLSGGSCGEGLTIKSTHITGSN